MEEAPENGKESSHSTHANGMNVILWSLSIWCYEWKAKCQKTGSASVL
jgi:hypothetical protein